MTSVRINDQEFQIEDGHHTFPLATFEINDIYSPDEDMEVKYRLAKWYKPTSQDWIGLFHEKWHNIQQYITFEWAPRRNRHAPACSQDVRSFTIPSKNIALPDTDHCKYQLLYICSYEQIGGISKPFHITTTRNNYDLPIIERSHDITARSSDSFVTVSSPGQDQTLEDTLGSFEIVKEWADCAEGTSTDKEPLTIETHHSDPSLMAIIMQNNEIKPSPALVRSQSKQSSFNHKSASSVQFSTAATCSNVDNIENQPTRLIAPISTQHFTKNDKLDDGTVSSNTLQCIRFLFNSPKKTCEVHVCTECRKTGYRLKFTRKFSKILRSRLKKERYEKKQAEGALNLKSVLIDQFAEQIKNLIHENASLISSNEEMFASKAQLVSLMDEVSIGFDRCLATSREESARIIAQKVEIEDALAKLKSHCSDLEFELSDLTSILAHGYLSSDDQQSDQIFTTSAHGVCDWKIVVNKKTERHLSIMAAQERAIYKLESDKKLISDDNESFQKTLSSEREMGQKREEELLKHLMEARMSRSELSWQSMVTEAGLRRQIASLGDALESARTERKMISKSTTTEHNTSEPQPDIRGSVESGSGYNLEGSATSLLTFLGRLSSHILGSTTEATPRLHQLRPRSQTKETAQASSSTQSDDCEQETAWDERSSDWNMTRSARFDDVMTRKLDKKERNPTRKNRPRPATKKRTANRRN